MLQTILYTDPNPQQLQTVCTNVHAGTVQIYLQITIYCTIFFNYILDSKVYNYTVQMFTEEMLKMCTITLYKCLQVNC